MHIFTLLSSSCSGFPISAAENASCSGALRHYHTHFADISLCGLISGVQDSAGKDPRIAMIKAIGFKELSVSNYHECMVCI